MSFFKVLKNCIFENLALIRVFNVDSISLRPLFAIGLFYNNDSNDVTFKRNSINEKLSHKRGIFVYVFKFLGGDVLSLGQLEYVLLSVYDFDRPIW